MKKSELQKENERLKAENAHLRAKAHSHTGAHSRCGDCGKTGNQDGSNFNPHGSNGFGSVEWYSCVCGNTWTEVENAT